MPAGELVDVLVMVVVVVMGTERVREAHQPAQGASELGVRMLEYPTVHARPGCGGAEVKMQREAVWLNMQSQKQKSGRGGREGGRGGGGGGGGGGDGGWGREGNPGRRSSPAATVRCVCAAAERAERGCARYSRLRSSRDVNPAPSVREPAH